MTKSNLWARQLNTEGHEVPRLLNDGGNLLGARPQDRGQRDDFHRARRREHRDLGGFVFANRDGRGQTMFVNEDSSLSVTIGESKTKKGYAFDPLIRETRAGVTKELRHAEAPTQAYGAILPLFIGAPMPE